MGNPDRERIDQETERQGAIDELDLVPAEKVAARERVREELDEDLGTGREDTPAHE